MMVHLDELRLLAEVGLMAALRCDVEAADGIFRAIEAERPAAAVFYIGLAVARLGVGQTAAAIGCLQRGLDAVAEADQRELHALLGLAHHLGGQASQSYQALQAAGDLPLARAMLERLKPGVLGA